MALATATPTGAPSVRMVLLKGLDARGFVFYTNYSSRKGQELRRNGKAALLFFWPELHRQVRVTGRVAKLASAESDAYFATRPPGSKLAACASPQSRTIASREWLLASWEKLRERYPKGDPPRPQHWGGYVVRPETMEFWQSGEHRLHDRIRFRKNRAGGWTRDRLAP